MILFLVLPLTAVFLTILYYYLTWPYDYWKKQGVKTADSIVPGFGHTLSMLYFRENLNFITNRLYKSCPTNSSMLGMFHFQTPVLMIRDPELVQTVLVKEFANFDSNLVYLDEHRDWFLSKNPFFAVGETWKKSRKLVISGMSQKKLKVMLQFMQRVSASFDEYFDRVSQSEVELRDLSYRCICEIFFQVAFGIKPKGNFVLMLNKLFESTWIRAIRQLLNIFVRSLAKVTGISFTPIEAQQFFKTLSKNIVEKHEIEKGMHYEDFLHMIMENSEDVNEETVLSILSAVIIDGYDTVANVAANVLFRLAWDQSAQDKLRKEIHDTLNMCDEKLAYESLKEMTYLDNVINETMRLNPILEIYAKICNKTTTLKGSDGQKCTLQPGNIVIIPTQSLHTDEKYWDNPDVFNPDRFYKNEVMKFAFLPFGVGPRMCPGMRFGLLEVKVLLISILQKHKVKPTDKTVTILKMDPRSYLPVVKGKTIVKLEKI